jgi:hypothetical protein
MPALTDVKTKMAGIRASFNNDVQRIRNTTQYSEQGKMQELAKSLIAHRRQAASLRSDFGTDNESVRLSLTSKLFGIPKNADPATVLVYRDAMDRAAKLDNPDDAASMLKRATEQGDPLLARAVASHAHSRKWSDITETYAESTGLAAELDDLNALPSGGALGLAVTALFSVPAPPELRATIGAVTDTQLQRIADGQESE